MSEREKLVQEYMRDILRHGFRTVDREARDRYRRFEIEVDGTKSAAVLLEDQAPRTSAAFWRKLPVEGYLMHAMWSGEFVRNLKPFELEGEVGHENHTLHVIPGDVTYLPEWKELAICYGEAFPSMPWGPVRLNVFARIVENMRAFEMQCIRIKLEGIKKFTIRKL